MRKAKIYLLRDPNTNDIRYVGQCLTSIDARLKRHVKTSREKQAKWTKKENWIRSLGGRFPIAELVEECPHDIANEREIFHIKFFREAGHRLTNLTEGGQGRVFRGENHPSYGKPLSAETKRKIGEANRGSRNGMFGRSIIPTNETKLKRSASLRNSVKLKESRAKKSFKEKISLASRDNRPILLASASNGEILMRFNSVFEAAISLGCSRCNLFHAIKDKRTIGKRIKLLGERCYVYYEKETTVEIPKESASSVEPRTNKG